MTKKLCDMCECAIKINCLFMHFCFLINGTPGGRLPRNHSGGSCYSEHLRLSLRIWSAKSGMKLTDKCIESWYCVVSGWEESAIGRFVGANDGIRSSLL